MHVPYRGNAAAYTDLIGGQIQLIFADVASGRPHVQSGALARARRHRADAACDAPGRSGDRRFVARLRGERLVRLRGPERHATPLVAKLNAAINAGLTDPEVKARFAQLEATPLVFTPKQYGEFLVSESERWGKAVKASGVRGDCTDQAWLTRCDIRLSSRDSSSVSRTLQMTITTIAA